MKTVLKIDPEFQNKIPPLTEAEFKQLEENILSVGEIYVPIVTWKGIIVDGHNRWKIIQKHPEIPYKTKEMYFSDKWEAVDWMYSNQLGRRNLTVEQKAYLIGKQYEARKHSRGGNRDMERDPTTGKFTASSQSGNLRSSVVDQIAKEQHIGTGTVMRSYNFSMGIDAIRETEPELADSILKAETKLPRSVVQMVGSAKPEEQIEMIQAVKEGKRIESQRNERKISGEESQGRPERICDRISGREIREIISTMSDDSDMEYTIEHLVDQIRVNADGFVRMLRNLIGDHRDLCKKNTEIVLKTIHDEVISPVEQMIKEKLNNEA